MKNTKDRKEFFLKIAHVVKFSTDLFKISYYSFDFLIDLKPMKEEIKENNDIF